LKSGSLNFLEPSGPVQACNGIALPLPYSITGIAAAACVKAMLASHQGDPGLNPWQSTWDLWWTK